MSPIPYKGGTYNEHTHKVVPKDAVAISLKGKKVVDSDAVVLDLRGDGIEPEELVRYLEEATDGGADAAYGYRGWGGRHPLRLLTEQIKAQTKPPRISEPGLWGVIEAWKRGIPTRRWVHHEEDRWVSDAGHIAGWDELTDIVLIRPGIEDGAS